MAAENLSAIASALATTAAPELSRQWNRETVLLKNINVKESRGQGGGKQVAWNIQTSGATAASFAEGSDIASGEFNTDPNALAVLPWGMYRSAFSVTNLETIAADANTANAVELEDIVKERFLGSMSKMLSVINRDIISGTGTDGSGNPTVIGLDSAIGTTGNYAGQSRTGLPEWAGNVNANGGVARPLSLSLLAASEALVYTASNRSPDMVIGSVGIHTKYEGLFEQAKVYVQAPGGAPLYSGSTQQPLTWRGARFLRDRDFTTGELMLLNSDDITLFFLGNEKLVMQNANGMIGKSVIPIASDGESGQTINIPFYVYPLGRKGSRMELAVEVYVQLRVRHPNRHCRIGDISET